MSTVKINTKTLTEQVEKGMKKPELASFYGISQVQMGKALKQAGLKIRKFHAPVFELVEESTETAVEETDSASPVTEEEIADSPLETTAIAEVPEEEQETNKATWTA